MIVDLDESQKSITEIEAARKQKEMDKNQNEEDARQQKKMHLAESEAVKNEIENLIFNQVQEKLNTDKSNPNSQNASKNSKQNRSSKISKKSQSGYSNKSGPSTILSSPDQSQD